MTETQKEQGTRLFFEATTELNQDVAGFIIDRQARGLSEGVLVQRKLEILTSLEGWCHSSTHQVWYWASSDE